MADELDTRILLWDHPDHRATKHALLRSCLDAWLTEPADQPGPLIFIDGFAGPDAYEGGYPGSPIVALDAAGEHEPALAGRDLHLVFVEEDHTLAERLQRAVDARVIPANLQVTIHPHTFDQSMRRFLERFHAVPMPPALLLLDPFAGAGVPFDLMKQFALQPDCDLLMVCMPETIARWTETRESIGGHVDRMFRGSEWRGLSQEELVALYRDNLQSAGFPHSTTSRFVAKRTRHEYFLIAAAHAATRADLLEKLVSGGPAS